MHINNIAVKIRDRIKHSKMGGKLTLREKKQTLAGGNRKRGAEI
jgi:hypothetical protein